MTAERKLKGLSRSWEWQKSRRKEEHLPRHSREAWHMQRATTVFSERSGVRMEYARAKRQGRAPSPGTTQSDAAAERQE